MKLSELINELRVTMHFNGDMEVVGMVDGETFTEIELNCPDSDSPCYIELYKNTALKGETHNE